MCLCKADQGIAVFEDIAKKDGIGWREWQVVNDNRAEELLLENCFVEATGIGSYSQSDVPVDSWYQDPMPLRYFDFPEVPCSSILLSLAWDPFPFHSISYAEATNVTSHSEVLPLHNCMVPQLCLQYAVMTYPSASL